MAMATTEIVIMEMVIMEIAGMVTEDILLITIIELVHIIVEKEVQIIVTK